MNPLLSGLLRVVLFACGLAVTCLPRALELRLGRALGRFFLLADRKRQRIAHENMRRCLPELGSAGRDELLRRNYEHYGILTLELLHLFSPIPGHWRAYSSRVARLEGFENWKKGHAEGKGMLFVSAHMANWELMVACGCMQGIPMTMVTRKLKPQWLHDLMESRRAETGAKCAFQPRTLPAVLKALRAGESVGFVMDQYHSPPMGTPVPFFGVVVDTLAAVGSIAQRTGAGIVMVTQIREPDGLLRVVIEPPLRLGEAAENPVAATAALTREVERLIRENPSQWLWVHRRFKNLKEPARA